LFTPPREDGQLKNRNKSFQSFYIPNPQIIYQIFSACGDKIGEFLTLYPFLKKIDPFHHLVFMPK